MNPSKIERICPPSGRRGADPEQTQSRPWVGTTTPYISPRSAGGSTCAPREHTKLRGSRKSSQLSALIAGVKERGDSTRYSGNLRKTREEMDTRTVLEAHVPSPVPLQGPVKGRGAEGHHFAQEPCNQRVSKILRAKTDFTDIAEPWAHRMLRNTSLPLRQHVLVCQKYYSLILLSVLQNALKCRVILVIPSLYPCIYNHFIEYLANQKGRGPGLRLQQQHLPPLTLNSNTNGNTNGITITITITRKRKSTS